MGEIAIAILAAGGSSRFDRDYPKSLALLRGRSLLSHSLEAALSSTLTPIILVVGHSAQQIIPLVPSNVTVLYNADWQRGISSSLQTALRSLETDRSVNAICIGLADQPYIGTEAYHRLAQAYQEGASLAAAAYQGARRNPVLLARSLWAEALSLTGDEGAKQLMQIHPVLEIPCDDTGNSIDVDTLDDLIRLEQDISISESATRQF
jgi:molybdenum cofactor cytidylyltransferase